LADEATVFPPDQFHHIVGDEAVATRNEFQGALALADAAVPSDDDTETEDLEKTPGKDDPGGTGLAPLIRESFLLLHG
jgi:hypothetical protein